jgi:hypothetical protein
VLASASILRLSFDHGLPVEQDIQLDCTEPNYGGARWWFLCPKCERRVSRLHLPSDGYRFFCRHCYDLSYESVQASRGKSESFFREIAQKLRITMREARLLIPVRDGAVHEVKRPVIEKVRDRRTGVALVITEHARGQGLSV